jgi:hypothetical protein
MARRAENEDKFPQWEETPDGGRRYWRDIPGRMGRRARYVKVVDADEKTVSFYQEIFDRTGTLVEIHEKFPIDKGHRRLEVK